MATVSRVRRLFASSRARQLRLRSRLSVRELASMCGVAHATLSRWETGASAPSVGGALAWARAMQKLGHRV